jgi:hypothetical protein
MGLAAEQQPQKDGNREQPDDGESIREGKDAILAP